MARIPVVAIDEVHVFTSDEPFLFVAGGRQGGKTSASRDAWERHQNCRSTATPTYDASHDWIDAGIVADPITVTDADLSTAPDEDLAALEAGSWLPGVTVRTSFDGGRRQVRIGPTTPCVTSLP